MKYKDFFAKHYNFSFIQQFEKLDIPEYLGQHTDIAEYPLPPILLPLLTASSWPGYKGFLFNPFNIDEELTYVEYFLEGHELVEIAKNKHQFLIWLLYDLYLNDDTDESAKSFFKLINITDITNVDDFFDSVHSESDLLQLNIFKVDTPSILLDNNIYEGAPSWLVCNINIELINKFIDDGEIEKAWYGLNSKAFHQGDTLDALHRISSRLTVNKAMFDDLITCWEAANHLMWNPRH